MWPLWERVAHRLWPAVDIPGSKHNLFGLHFTAYCGPNFTLPDGTEIARGDIIGELHLNNQMFMAALAGPAGSATGSEKWAIVPMFREQLRELAAWTESGSLPGPIKAIYGVTIMGRGAVRVGFTIRPRKRSIVAAFDRLFLDGLMILYTPEGQERMMLGKTVNDQAAEAWMSIGELGRRYGADRPGRSTALI